MPADRTQSNKKASSSRSSLPYCRTNEYAGSSPSSQHNFTIFTPNVTPGAGYSQAASQTRSDAAIPLDDLPAATPSQRREPQGKRRAEGHIPRPPNAFMLFRSAFIKREHVPGSIQEGGLSLSKVIGNQWHALLPEAKREWEEKARAAKEEHAKMYPEYQFCPVHNKEKKAAKRKAKVPLAIFEEEHRCDEELVATVRRLGKKRRCTAATTLDAFSGVDEWAPPPPIYQPAPFHGSHNRSFSAPVPSLPFLLPLKPPAASRPPSPVGNISRAQRNTTTVRASSVPQPVPHRSRAYPTNMHLPMHVPVLPPMPPMWQRDWSPAHEPDISFPPAYIQDESSFSQQKDYVFPGYDHVQQQLPLTIDPFDCGPLGVEDFRGVSSSALSSARSAASAFPFHPPFTSSLTLDTSNGSSGNSWVPISGSTSTISASPAPSDHSLPYALNAGLLTQQLEIQAQEQPFDGWMQQGQMVEPSQQQYDLGGGNDFSNDLLGGDDFGVDIGAQMGPPQYMGNMPQPYSPMVVPSGLQAYSLMGPPPDRYAQMGQPWYPRTRFTPAQIRWLGFDLNEERTREYCERHAGGRLR